MDLKAGDVVERRHGRGESRFGRIQSRCKDGCDDFDVAAGIGLTHIDWGRDLRPVDDPVPPSGRPF
jgi:hypothetical protein